LSSILKENTSGDNALGIALEIQKLRKYFFIDQGYFRDNLTNKAVDDVSLGVRTGEFFGLVGESGCGKSTLANVLLRLIEPTSGRITFDGDDLLSAAGAALKEIRRKMQVVFQDPYSSLNPRMKVLDIVGRGLEVHHLAASAEDKKNQVVHWLERVGLGAEVLERYIHEFSGGQQQRIAIARALCIHPTFLILDEPTSALDVSIQAQICNLLKDLKSSLSITYLFISHNLAVVRYISDRIGVMYRGRMVEIGTKNEIFNSPRHPYTEALLSANLGIEADGKHRIILPGFVQSAINLPKGCRFHPRCFRKQSDCEREEPSLAPAGPDHQVACFHPSKP
jgi:oligopeptide/dipeptide ABC transporter ATP-binding protein